MRRYPIPSVFAGAALVLASLLVACRPAPTPDAAGGVEAGAKTYPITGKVIGVNLSSGEVELDAKGIPGYMGAMTMPYKLKDPAVLSELHGGDSLKARLIVGKDSEVLDQIVITGQAAPTANSPGDLQPLVAGEAVPDFALLNQDGHTVHLSDYRGRVLLVTFVYTRCPLADYCPRMSHNFALADKALATDPKLYAETHLLSISFDPKYDTPAVLKSYGGAYTGRYVKETFNHWEFAAPSERDLPRLLSFFDVAATPEKNHTVTHSLSTIIIGKDGRIQKWYPSNDWTAPALVDDVRKVLGQKA